MIEIMGQYLDKPFNSLRIDATKVVETEESKYQVWRLSTSDFDKLVKCDDWIDGFGWWRAGRCIYEGSADVEYTVNGHKMYGYAPYTGFTPLNTQYISYSNWLYEVMNLSTNTNTVIFAESLAHDNGLKLSEFISKYEK